MRTLEQWDLKIFGAFNGLAGKNRFFDAIVIFFARYYTVIMPIGLFFYILETHAHLSFRQLIYSQLIVLFVARGVVVETIRLFYRRTRPFQDHKVTQLIKKYIEASFPSGHAITLISMGLALGYFDPGLGWFMVLSGVVVGLARLVAGVHYPLDVLAGIVLAWPSAAIGMKIYYYFIK